MRFFVSQPLFNLLRQTGEDVLYLIPYFFLTFLFLEYLEHKTHSKLRKIIQASNRFGPLWGVLGGVSGGCGIAAAAANFYVTRVITFGTLIAVYLATSDEMLPLLISEGASWQVIFSIVAFKSIYAVAAGLIIDFLNPPKKQPLQFKELCQQANCRCAHDRLVKSALIHTTRLTGFVFLVCMALNAFWNIMPLSEIARLFKTHETEAVFISAFLGLIPNCGISVMLTQLYIEGVLSIKALTAGLFSGSGMGLIVLYKLNPDKKELLKIAGLLFVCGVIGGHIAGFLL